MHNNTFWYRFIFGRYSPGKLTRSSTGDLNFCVHSTPLWEPYVEKLIMLRASVHRPVGGAL